MGRTKVSFRTNCVVPHEGVLLKEAEMHATFNDNHHVDCGTLYIEETKLTWIRDRDGKGISIDRDLIDSYKVEYSYDGCILHINVKAEVVLLEYYRCLDRDDYTIDKLNEISFMTFNEVAKIRMFEAMEQLLAPRPAPSENE